MMKFCVALLTLITAIMVAGCSESNPPAETKKTTSTDPNEARKKSDAAIRKILVDFLTEHVKSQFKDPESAQFRNTQYYSKVYVYEKGLRIPAIHKVCGEVNAKNSFGGYVGFRRFYSLILVTVDGKMVDETLTAEIEKPSVADPEGFDIRFKRACVDAVITTAPAKEEIK